MEQKIIEGKESNVAVKVEDKKLKLIASNEGKIGGADLIAYVKLEAVVDALEEAIPGDQKSIAAGLKAALGLSSPMLLELLGRVITNKGRDLFMIQLGSTLLWGT